MSGAVASEGARLLGLVVAKNGAAETGRRLAVSEGMVRHVVAGRKTPGAPLQARAAEVLSIPAETWKSPPSLAGSTPAPKPRRAPRPAGPLSGLTELQATMALFDERIALATDETPNGAWVALLRGKADTADKLAKLQGEGELTIAMIVRSRAWRELVTALMPILNEHPEVASKFQALLEELEEA